MASSSLGLIGLGQMARAMAIGLTQLPSAPQLVGYDPHASAVEQFLASVPNMTVANSNSEVAHQTDTVVLAVKPHLMKDVCTEIQPSLSHNPLIISIAAGVSLTQLADWTNTERVARVMPNTPLLVGSGASGYSLGSGVESGDDELISQLLSAVGVTFRLEEKLLDAVTGLSGSGPAYVFLMIEALADGGVKMGLPRAVSQELAAHTVLGAAQMVVQLPEHPAELRDQVTSPGGTTIAGLHTLEQYGVRAGLIAAVEEATRRSQELGAID